MQKRKKDLKINAVMETGYKSDVDLIEELIRIKGFKILSL